MEVSEEKSEARDNSSASLDIQHGSRDGSENTKYVQTLLGIFDKVTVSQCTSVQKAKAAFNNYVDPILPNFNLLLPRVDNCGPTFVSHDQEGTFY